MNLEWKHFPLIVLGVTIGGGVGWIASFLFKPGLLPVLDLSLGLRWAGAMLGGLAGLGCVTVAIVVRAGRDPNVGPARYFMRLNGMGSTLIGHSEQRDDGSYVTTEWFTVLWIPVFPVCRYRVTKHEEASTPFSTPYTIHEKMPLRLGDVKQVYGITLLVLLVIVGLAWFISR